MTTYAVVLTAQATSDEAVPIATHQLAMTLWGFLAFVLDAIAIAAQAITGRHLGAGDVAAARAVTRRMVGWGVVSGVVTGVGLAAASPVLGVLFTTDDDVRRALVPVLLVAALGQPVAGVVFVLDGVLIGAGDGTLPGLGGHGGPRRLRSAGAAVAATRRAAACPGCGPSSLVFMGGRFVTLVAGRGDRWLVTGAATPPWPVKPLYGVALGLVVIALYARSGEFDASPTPSAGPWC